MDTHEFAEWLASLSTARRTAVFIHMYSTLTVYTRELFFPDVAKGKEEVVIHMLHGINELHHTLANRLGRDLNDNDWPLSNFVLQLKEIADQYRLGRYLAAMMEAVQRYHPRDAENE